MVAMSSYGLAGCLGVAGGVLLVLCVFGAVALLDGWRRHFGRDSIEHARVAAEFALRDIRRQAVRDLLDAERQYHGRFDEGEVIEGTAVEVRE